MSVQQNSVKNTCDIEPGEWGLVPYARDDSQNVRLGSSSSQTSQSNSGGDICRICHCEADALNPLLAPCYCSGSLKYVHQACLQQWLTASETRSCELCKFPFIMHTKIKPFNEWRRLKMSGHERRRLCCAVLFHCVAALCVVWSLFVLIDRAAEEVQRGQIAWPFWTKLVVVAVGFTGGAVFMYIQCRQYLHLCNRWRAHNRILLIQNAPEKMNVIPPSPPVIPYISTQSSATRSTLDQVVANIENNPNYEQRNWSYDVDDNSACEVSKLPAGEMRNRDIMRDLVYVSQDAYQQPKPATTSTAPPNSSVFLENKDILGENKGSNTPSKIIHRHSTALMINTNLEQKQPDFRRYSDTKLLQNFNLANNLTITNVLGAEVNFSLNESVAAIPETNTDGRLHFGSKYDLDEAGNKDPFNNTTHSVFHISNEKPCISDIIFENSSNFDPLELNIQEMLELDIQTSHKKSVLSLNHRDSRNGSDRNKSLFKSLPNLSASSENLLP